MPGTFPSGVGVTNEDIQGVYVNYVSNSVSGHQKATEQPGHLWKITFSTGVLARSDWQALHGFLNAQRGRLYTFTYIPRGRGSALGSTVGTVQVVGAHTAGDTTVNVDGLGNNINGALKAGDFIKFENHAKIYQVQSDVNSNGSGEGTITIIPELFSSLSDNEGVTYDDVPFTVANTQDDVPCPVDINGYAQFDLEFLERWN